MNKDILKITFEESLSDSSLDLIEKVFRESLGFKVKIERLEGGD